MRELRGYGFFLAIVFGVPLAMVLGASAIPVAATVTVCTGSAQAILGDTLHLSATVAVNRIPRGYLPVLWLSGDTTVATVEILPATNDDVRVRAVRLGATYIQASSTGQSSRACVTVVPKLVVPPPVASVTLCAVGIGLLLAGPPAPLAYVAANGSELHNVRWATTAPAVMSVSSVGLVTPLAEGNGFVTAVGTDGNSVPQPAATFPVVVKATWAGVTGNPFAFAGLDGSVSAPSDPCAVVRIQPG